MTDGDRKGSPEAQVTTAIGDVADEVLVVRARAKDEAAFEELVNRYQNKLYRLAMRFVRNETDAQEILQDAFLSAWRNLPSFEGRAQFGSWMYRVTVNAALMMGNKDTAGTQYSGGLENLVRFLENWSGVTFTYKGSLVCLWQSAHANSNWPGTPKPQSDGGSGFRNE